MRRLALPGAIGGLAGATFLSGLSTEAARPVMALLLFTLAIGILVRFSVRARPGSGVLARLTARPAVRGPLGLVGGVVNATGGGGWGPVVTSTLISTSRGAAPGHRLGVGHEFVVTAATSLGFLVGLGSAGIDLRIVAALMVGGVVAAPVAARLAGILPAPVLGVCVGGLILLLSLHPVLALGGVDGLAARAVEGGLAVVWLAVLTRTIVTLRADRIAARADAEAAAGLAR